MPRTRSTPSRRQVCAHLMKSARSASRLRAVLMSSFVFLISSTHPSTLPARLAMPPLCLRSAMQLQGAACTRHLKFAPPLSRFLSHMLLGKAINAQSGSVVSAWPAQDDNGANVTSGSFPKTAARATVFACEYDSHVNQSKSSTK